MFRKIGIAAVLVVTGLFVLNKAGLCSYGATAWQNVRSSLKKQVPLEFEIQRLHYEVNQLVPDMRRHVNHVAQEMVDLQTLREEVADARTNLAKQKSSIMAMTSDLEKGATAVIYGGREYSAERVREKLNRDFASYQRCEAEVKSKEQLVEAKERALDAEREQLTAIRGQKEELEVEIARMEAEVKTLRLVQTQSKYHYDDSGLARCKATLAEIKNRLKVEQKAVELSGQFANDAIPVETKTKSTRELTKEIQAYFNERPTDNKVVEKK
jgi:chromosome segregation ATPase